jgi:anion-transporting  ArsA/GET3 family ATPase
MPPTLSAARVAVVSGKGGVGKTTVAAAIALASARAGRHTLIAEIEEREALAPIFGLTELGFEERALAPNLTGLSIQPDESLVEYLQQFYGIPRLSRAIVQSKLVEFATNTAPGLRDILEIGKIKEAERRRKEGRYVFDQIVLDAPATGRLPRLLDAPRAIVDLVHSGPIATQAQGVLDMVTDPKRLQVVLVAQPEDMSVRETIESAETLQKSGIELGPVVVNGMWPQIPALGKDPAAALQPAAAALGLGAQAVAELASVAGAHARRARNQRAAANELESELKLPCIELPYLFTERVGRHEIDELAGLLLGSELW